MKKGLIIMLLFILINSIAVYADCRKDLDDLAEKIRKNIEEGMDSGATIPHKINPPTLIPQSTVDLNYVSRSLGIKQNNLLKLADIAKTEVHGPFVSKKLKEMANAIKNNNIKEFNKLVDELEYYVNRLKVSTPTQIANKEGLLQEISLIKDSFYQIPNIGEFIDAGRLGIGKEIVSIKYITPNSGRTGTLFITKEGVATGLGETGIKGIPKEGMTLWFRDGASPSVRRINADTLAELRSRLTFNGIEINVIEGSNKFSIRLSQNKKILFEFHPTLILTEPKGMIPSYLTYIKDL